MEPAGLGDHIAAADAVPIRGEAGKGRVDSDAAARTSASEVGTLDGRRVRVRDALPIVTIHAVALGAIWTGFSWTAAGVAFGLYWVRMFCITGFYHRYFSHRTFRTSRAAQFAFALVGTTAAQRGPVWWAAHHREHHRHSDEEPDPHSPWWKGLLWSHTIWFLTARGRATDWNAVPDWKRYPELRWLERNHMIGPLGLAGMLAVIGWMLGRFAPGLRTDAAQMTAWGFGISTVVLYHATFTVNSLAHVFGSQRFDTGDDSRNNWLLAIITLGEGWHNNHHHHPGTVRQGFYWWEYDPTYWVLRAMSWVGLVWDLRGVPARVYEQAAAAPSSLAPGTTRPRRPRATRANTHNSSGSDNNASGAIAAQAEHVSAADRRARVRAGAAL